MRGKPYNHIADMVIDMKTTFNIDDALMRQLRVEAARRNTTMTSIVEAGIRHVIAYGDGKPATLNKNRPLPTWKGGRELVDITNRDELYRVFDEEKRPWS